MISDRQTNEGVSLAICVLDESLTQIQATVLQN